VLLLPTPAPIFKYLKYDHYEKEKKVNSQKALKIDSS